MAIGNSENDALSIKRYILEGSILQLAILLCLSLITFKICMCFPDFDPFTNLELIASIRNPKSISTNWSSKNYVFFQFHLGLKKNKKSEAIYLHLGSLKKNTTSMSEKEKGHFVAALPKGYSVRFLGQLHHSFIRPSRPSSPSKDHRSGWEMTCHHHGNL